MAARCAFPPAVPTVPISHLPAPPAVGIVPLADFCCPDRRTNTLAHLLSVIYIPLIPEDSAHPSSWGSLPPPFPPLFKEVVTITMKTLLLGRAQL